MSGVAAFSDAYASTSTDWVKATKAENCSLERYSVEGVERKNVLPYEVSDAVLDEYVMEVKERVIVEVDVRDDKSRYIPPPLFAEHEEKEV